MTSRLPPKLPVRSPPAPHPEDEVRFTLRASHYLFTLIDQARSRRPGKISRNTWILEAITEKLKKEQQG
ncbi:hypothetical protein FHS85_004118 [Rhodoligotrophos appendicifer]|uniref:hypothetical protein n=1 Tax=Rhodoligotrophos appendicifer TaxID=987056 RepID=UPI001185F172|nr:hypothetical protein [Rhodoligotrophos appendicifer]